jgi:predicted phosphodiesterase
MKILVLSDIHANWYALDAILDKESYDALIFLGDVVDLDQIQESASGSLWTHPETVSGVSEEITTMLLPMVLDAGAH